MGRVVISRRTISAVGRTVSVESTVAIAAADASVVPDAAAINALADTRTAIEAAITAATDAD